MRQLDKATIAILLVMFLIIGMAIQESRDSQSSNVFETTEVFQGETISK